jgi:hypothetical protein
MYNRLEKPGIYRTVAPDRPVFFEVVPLLEEMELLLQPGVGILHPPVFTDITPLHRPLDLLNLLRGMLQPRPVTGKGEFRKVRLLNRGPVILGFRLSDLHVVDVEPLGQAAELIKLDAS